MRLLFEIVLPHLYLRRSALGATQDVARDRSSLDGTAGLIEGGAQPSKEKDRRRNGTPEHTIQLIVVLRNYN